MAAFRSVVVTRHAKLSYHYRMMIIHNDDGVVNIPIQDVEEVIILSTEVAITTALINELSKLNVKIIFCGDSQRPVCETVNYYPNNRSNKLLEKQFNWDEKRKEILWTKVVANKLENQIEVLEKMNKPTKELRGELDKLELNDFTNREATIARKYFPLLFEKGFSRRNQSAINDALNYGYSILLSRFSQEIVVNGYLTYLGIHHVSEENSYNLASDLMEPFRPAVDFYMANKKINNLTPDIKFGLVSLLNLQIKYNGKTMEMTNAIKEFVKDCLKYLSEEKQKVKIEMEFLDEVPDNAISSHV